MVENPAFRVGDALLVAERHQITAQGDIGRLHIHADGQGFQRRAPGVKVARIVAEHRQVRGIAAGLHACRDGCGKADFRAGGKLIHHRGFRSHQRGFAAERRNGFVGHAVAKDGDIFHWWGSSSYNRPLEIHKGFLRKLIFVWRNHPPPAGISQVPEQA